VATSNGTRKSQNGSARGGVRAAIVRSAFGALAGGAAVGAARAVKHQNHRRRPGLHVPHDKRFDLHKATQDVDIKRLLRQIGDAAEQIELRSDDVRQLSAQAKRLSRRLA
jgi:hypothetical protein